MPQKSPDPGAAPTNPAVGRRGVLLGLLGIPAVAAAGCGGGNGNQAGNGAANTTGGSTTTGTTTSASTTAGHVVETPVMVRGQKANYHGTRSVVGNDSTTVDLYDFYFEPTVLAGSPGQEITVNLLNEGQVPHTFTVEEQKIDVVLQPGQSGKTKLKFPETGQQELVCRFHVAQGMLGLIVTT